MDRGGVALVPKTGCFALGHAHPWLLNSVADAPLLLAKHSQPRVDSSQGHVITGVECVVSANGGLVCHSF